jgi:protein SERAC1
MQMEELYSTEGDYGLRTLSEPDEAVVEYDAPCPQVDPPTNQTGATSIVFVHGLTGNRETTWTHNQSKTFWPQTLLAPDLPNARILTFGYDADIVGALNTAGSNTLRDHGKSLANDVALRRMRSRTVGYILCKAHSCSVSSRGLGTTSSYLCRAQPWRARGRTGQI